MLRDKAGNKLFRAVKVRVIFPDNIFPDRNYTQHAGPKQGFGPDGIDQMLGQIADQLDTLYPFWEFQLQEMTPEHRTARYLMTFAGYRAVPAPTQPIADSTTPEPETPSNLTAGAASEAPVTSQDVASRATALGDFR
jgi:hypothetical protein